MTEHLHAEWTKLRTLRATGWAGAALVALTVALSAFVCSALTTQGGSPGMPGDEDVVMNSLSGVVLGQIAAVTLGTLAVTGEYASGMIRTTLTATPSRWRVLTAKALVVVAMSLPLGLLASAAAFAVGQPILHGNGFEYANGYPAASLADPATLRAVSGSGLYLCLVSLLALGVGTILRHTGASVTTVLGLLLVPYMVTLTLPDGVREPLQRLSPMSAGLAVQRTVPRHDSVPIGEWAGLGVLGLWTAAALAVAFVLLHRRDA